MIDSISIFCRWCGNVGLIRPQPLQWANLLLKMKERRSGKHGHGHGHGPWPEEVALPSPCVERSLPQFKYPGVLFTSEGNYRARGQQADWCDVCCNVVAVAKRWVSLLSDALIDPTGRGFISSVCFFSDVLLQYDIMSFCIYIFPKTRSQMVNVVLWLCTDWQLASVKCKCKNGCFWVFLSMCSHSTPSPFLLTES